MIEWLKTNGFLITSLLAVGVAWGDQQHRVTTLENAIKSQQDLRMEVQILKEQNARVEERTKLLLELLSEQNRQLKSIDRTVKSQSR